MNDELLQTFISQAEDDYEVTENLRDAANEDMRFCNVPGGMWEGWLDSSHAQADRVRMEFDIVSDYVHRYVGEWTLNRAQVQFEHDDDSTEEEAKLLNDIYRADFIDNDGQEAQDVAIQEVAQCGAGAFRLLTRDEDDEDIENEKQDIHFAPIYSAFNHVIWDASAKRSDKSDAMHCTVLTPYTYTAFERQFPNIPMDSAFIPTSRKSLGWFANDEIYVAERYEVKIKTVTMLIYRNVMALETKAFEKGKEPTDPEWEFVRERKVKQRQVYKSIFTGSQFIEKPKRIAGKFIPIIQMYGFRTYVDGIEFSKGLVRPLKDANRLFNTSISRIAEDAASSGDRIPYFTKEQVDGLEDELSDNTDKAYQVINAIEDAEGNKVAMGPVGYVEPNHVDPNTSAATELVSNYVQRHTGNAPQDQVDPDASGKAINALRKRENLNTQVMSDNILKAIKHSGKVWLSMAKEVYSEQRKKRTIAIDGTASMSPVNSISMTDLDSETGEPRVINDLSKGDFKVNIKVSPQYESQREATLESIERVIAALGDNNPFSDELTDAWVSNISGVGLEGVKKKVRERKLISGAVEPETEEEAQMLQGLSQQKNPQEELTLAAAEQQRAEAENLQASSVQKMADAKKKQAEAVKITEEIQDGFIERRLKQLDAERPKRLRYNPQTGSLDPVNTDARS